MKKKKSFILIIFIFLYSSIYSQHRSNTITDFLNYSTKSLGSEKNKKKERLNKNTEKLFNKSFLPSFSFNLNLPSYNRSISEVRQPDGTYAFRESSSANSRISLSISQKIALTGGELSISNSINRRDIFGDSNSTSYSSSWININLNQPLNFFNSMKWDRKIYKANTEQEKISLKKEDIEIKIKAINYYFKLLKIDRNKNIIKNEIKIAKSYRSNIIRLIELGKKMNYDSLDINIKLIEKKQELRYLNRNQNLTLESVNTFFKGKDMNSSDSFITPNFTFKIENLNFYIDKYIDLHTIKKGQLLSLTKRIKQLEKNKFYTANLSLGIGFNNSTDQYRNIFQSPNESQNFSISLSFPLLDFGTKKIELVNANTEFDIAKISLEQDKIKGIENIKLIYEKVSDLFFNINIEKSKEELLKIKIKHMRELLFNQKILLKDYSDMEVRLSNTKNEIINNIQSLYEHLLKLEKITLVKII